MADNLVADNGISNDCGDNAEENLAQCVAGTSSQVIEARSIIQAIMIIGKKTADKPISTLKR